MVKMKISKKRLREIIKEELINELGFDVVNFIPSS